MTTSADPVAVLRSRGYLALLLLLAAALGVPVAAAACGFLALVSKAQGWLFADLPRGLGFHGAPFWWPLPVALSHLPWLPLVPGVAMGIGAMCAVMLQLPLTSVLLATLTPPAPPRPARRMLPDRRHLGYLRYLGHLAVAAYRRQFSAVWERAVRPADV